MLGRLKSLLRITAVRLSIAYTLAFGILAVGLVFYMTGGAVDYLRTQYRESINKEADSLKQIYESRGLNSLIRTMEIRARIPGANLYVVSDPSGQIIAGNVRSINSRVLKRRGWILHPFTYQPFLEAESDRVHRAIARSFSLPNGMRILLGQDIGEPERLKNVVGRSLSLSMAMMLIAGFLIWFFVGRRALKRIDMVSKSTERILAGDQSERLPVMGSNDEFDRLSIRMNTMLDRISLLDSGLRNVSDSIAHDLKTPLTRLRNRVEDVLGDKPNPKESREALLDVVAESDQLIKTFNALLMISRVEAGSQVSKLSKINMSDVMADVVELYEPVAEEEGFKILANIEPNILMRGSRELLSQALTNLLDNAFKYAKPEDDKDAQIKVELSKIKNRVIAKVSDNGPGIPEDQFEWVTERFARLDESRSKPGTGLGLSLTSAVAKLHSGTLSFGNAEPGLITTLEFPLYDSKYEGMTDNGG